MHIGYPTVFYMMNIRHFLLCFSLSISLFLLAEIPAGYYQSANGKTGESLRQALHEIIDNHTAISYSGLEPYYQQTDFDSKGYLMDMYSTCSFTADDANCSQSRVCQCWNKEHSVPSSWFKKATPMYSDLFHVIPTDARVNNYRGNMPYGETSSTAYIANDSHSLGHIGSSSFSGFSGTVFEPDDEYKGDFARNYLYMVTRYTTTNFTQSGDAGAVFTYSNSSSGLTQYAINLFLKWHRQDPVSQKEIDRNNAVYGIQHNRNPFIDYPYLAEYIWGQRKGQTLSLATDVISSEDERFVPGVSDGSSATLSPTLHSTTETLVFPSMAEGASAQRTITFTGSRLTAAITITLSGANAEAFTLAQTTIASAQANQEHTLNITYHPVSKGTHHATLTIASNGADPLVISLQGTCTESHIVRWLVNGQEYTNGEPDTQVANGTAPQHLPDAPESCSETSNQFAGWTTYPINSSSQEAPIDLFSSEEEAPVITEPTDFHAVFAHLTEQAGSEPMQQLYVFSEHYSNATAVTSVQLDDITITFDKADASTAAKYYDTGSGVRVYAKSQMIFNGINIQKIVFSYGSNDHTNAISVNTGSFNTDTWTGNADEIIFTIGGSSKYRTISTITITSQEQTTQYVYSDFITTCSSSTPSADHPTKVTEMKPEKFVQDGHLFIRYNDQVYDATGQYIR